MGTSVSKSTRLCLLVMIGVRADGRKELIALAGAAAPPSAVDGDLRQSGHQGAANVGPALARWCGMSPLRQALAGYLAVRRALGYKLDRPEKLLGQFISYLEAAGATTITNAPDVCLSPARADAAR